MTEAELQSAILDLARLLGYLAYHTYDSRRSASGFPDLVLVRPTPRRLIFAELKTAAGKVTPAQSGWLTALACVESGVYLWRPADWRSGAVEAALRA